MAGMDPVRELRPVITVEDDDEIEVGGFLTARRPGVSATVPARVVPWFRPK